MPVLPMGTIMTGCMLLALLFATQIPPFQPLWRTRDALPLILRRLVGLVVVAAGLWNALWYASRHITEFWGIAALVSGILMIIAGGYIMAYESMLLKLRQARPIVLLGLLICMLVYATGIYRL